MITVYTQWNLFYRTLTIKAAIQNLSIKDNLYSLTTQLY